MQRPSVIGVPRPSPVELSPQVVPRVAFEAAITIAVAVASALAMARWLFVGGPGIETLLLVPFFFVSAPLVAWLCGHGVVYWDKHESAFLAIDAAARPLLANLLLVVFAVASVLFAVVFLHGGPSGDGCLPGGG